MDFKKIKVRNGGILEVEIPPFLFILQKGEHKLVFKITILIFHASSIGGLDFKHCHTPC